MYVNVDDLWSTPSTLHLRVTVHDSENKWRQRFYHAIPLNEIPEEALAALIRQAADTDTDSSYEDHTLF